MNYPVRPGLRPVVSRFLSAIWYGTFI
jgi:hypothetical protein